MIAPLPLRVDEPAPLNIFRNRRLSVAYIVMPVVDGIVQVAGPAVT